MILKQIDFIFKQLVNYSDGEKADKTLCIKVQHKLNGNVNTQKYAKMCIIWYRHRQSLIDAVKRSLWGAWRKFLPRLNHVSKVAVWCKVNLI